MRKRIEDILNSIFSIFVMIAVAGGVIIFLLFVFAIITGGKGGEKMAVAAAKVYLPYFIKAASIALLAGIINMYITNTHFLSLKVEKEKGQTPAA